jgi:hypothetical protein
MWGRAIVACLWLGSIGCSDLCASDRPPRCDVRESGCQEQVQAIVVCMRGAASSELPAISVISTTELEERLRAGSDADMMRTLPLEGALKTLGLLDPEVGFFEASVENAIASVLAFYSTEDEAIYIVDRGAADDPWEAVATLAHELVHAAQDEEHDLGALSDEVETHEDLLRLKGAVEGEATFYTLEAIAWSYRRSPEDVDWASFYAEPLQELQAEVATAPSPYFSVFVTMPYVLGARWVTREWERGDDERARASVPERPPTSATFLFDPWGTGRYPALRVETSPCDAPPAPAGFELSYEDEMGAPLLYAFLVRWGMTDADARALAIGWQRDDLYVYDAGDGRVAIVWRLVFDDAETPPRIAAHLSSTGAFRAASVEDTVVLLRGADTTWTWAATGPAVCAPPG